MAKGPVRKIAKGPTNSLAAQPSSLNPTAYPLPPPPHSALSRVSPSRSPRLLLALARSLSSSRLAGGVLSRGLLSSCRHLPVSHLHSNPPPHSLPLAVAGVSRRRDSLATSPPRPTLSPARLASLPATALSRLASASPSGEPPTVATASSPPRTATDGGHLLLTATPAAPPYASSAWIRPRSPWIQPPHRSSSADPAKSRCGEVEDGEVRSRRPRPSQ